MEFIIVFKNPTTKADNISVTSQGTDRDDAIYNARKNENIPPECLVLSTRRIK